MKKKESSVAQLLHYDDYYTILILYVLQFFE